MTLTMQERQAVIEHLGQVENNSRETARLLEEAVHALSVSEHPIDMETAGIYSHHTIDQVTVVELYRASTGPAAAVLRFEEPEDLDRLIGVLSSLRRDRQEMGL